MNLSLGSKFGYGLLLALSRTAVLVACRSTDTAGSTDGVDGRRSASRGRDGVEDPPCDAVVADGRAESSRPPQYS